MLTFQGQIFFFGLVLIGAFAVGIIDARDISDVTDEQNLFEIVKRSADSEPEPLPENDPEVWNPELGADEGGDRVYQVRVPAVVRTQRFLMMSNMT